jgi:hypothetical protein
VKIAPHSAELMEKGEVKKIGERKGGGFALPPLFTRDTFAYTTTDVT